MTAVFESRPRFKDCPPICLAQNLPAFKDRKEADAFHEKHSPGSAIWRFGHCDFCQHWHYTAKARPPSGSSSGGGRSL